MPSHKQPGEIFPYWSVPPVVVIRELCKVAEKWPDDVVRLRRLAVCARKPHPAISSRRCPGSQGRCICGSETMAESSEKPQEDGESEPPTNYGRQK
jgi:hypothetical protein